MSPYFLLFKYLFINSCISICSSSLNISVFSKFTLRQCESAVTIAASSITLSFTYFAVVIERSIADTRSIITINLCFFPSAAIFAIAICHISLNGSPAFFFSSSLERLYSKLSTSCASSDGLSSSSIWTPFSAFAMTRSFSERFCIYSFPSLNTKLSLIFSGISSFL